VVVTHDETLASEAGRVIHMLDGRILSEHSRSPGPILTRVPASPR